MQVLLYSVAVLLFLYIVGRVAIKKEFGVSEALAALGIVVTVIYAQNTRVSPPPIPVVEKPTATRQATVRLTIAPAPVEIPTSSPTVTPTDPPAPSVIKSIPYHSFWANNGSSRRNTLILETVEVYSNTRVRFNFAVDNRNGQEKIDFCPHLTAGPKTMYVTDSNGTLSYAVNSGGDLFPANECAQLLPGVRSAGWAAFALNGPDVTSVTIHREIDEDIFGKRTYEPLTFTITP